MVIQTKEGLGIMELGVVYVAGELHTKLERNDTSNGVIIEI